MMRHFSHANICASQNVQKYPILAVLGTLTLPKRGWERGGRGSEGRIPRPRRSEGTGGWRGKRGGKDLCEEDADRPTRSEGRGGRRREGDGGGSGHEGKRPIQEKCVREVSGRHGRRRNMRRDKEGNKIYEMESERRE